ncbi:hypothetical protein KR009_002074 [Drosophila setifemur]|nr:hypothetical protein KR009_002074 [Drosophila setifemur]
MCFYGPVSLIKKILPAGSNGSCLLVMGLDNAGKSALIDRLAPLLNGNSIKATTEASEWSFKVKTSKLQLWDLKGEVKNRQTWPNYYGKAKVLIFVIDSKDAVRLSEARCVLCDVLLHEELEKAPLLIVSNKMEISGSLAISAIVDMMGLNRLEGRVWAIKECSVRTGEGVQVGFDIRFFF